MSWQAGVDIGGTFTDIVLVGDDGAVVRRKVLSTPHDYSAAIRDGMIAAMQEHAIAPADIRRFVHGTTVATNAILEGRGAVTALITTRGFRDVLELRRLRVPELYNLSYERPAPLVPRRRRFEVEERIDAKGRVLTKLNVATVKNALQLVRESGARALAISLLHSYANPAHELRVAELARRILGPQIFICCSSSILPEIREYERTSTVVINAYIGPVVHGYVKRLQAVLRDLGIPAPLQIMQSNGGVLGAEAVLEKPAYIVESGPAAGVIGGARIAQRSGNANVVTIDMGGTTAKASMVEDGHVTKTSEYEIGAGINISSHLTKGRGHALKLSVIDVSEIGAGGGSLAVVDRSGLLRVGPQSAGADPGPVCYGRGGTTPTLTDAMVLLGYVNPDGIAGGAVPIDANLAHAAIEREIAKKLRRTVRDAAFGIYVLAATTMTRAVKAVSTYRGRDPRDFGLVAFGGNGALMAAQIADALQIRRIVVPQMPGLFSAFGLLIAQPEQEFTQTLFGRTSGVDSQEVEAAYRGLEARARRALLQDGANPDMIEVRRLADLRYSGQAYELTVAVPEGRRIDPRDLAEAFGVEHQRTYGHRALDEPVDLVSLRLQAVERVKAGREILPTALLAAARSAGEPVSRAVYFGPEHGELPTPVISRADLSGAARSGPLIIEEYDATCLVPPGWSASIDPMANIVLSAE